MNLISWLRARFGRPHPPEDDERQRLLDALQSLQQDFEALESLFNMTSDGDMIDYYVHQHKALNARYAYLLKQARARGITYQPRVRETMMR